MQVKQFLEQFLLNFIKLISQKFCEYFTLKITLGRFYKKLDQDSLPKFFQIGTILDNILDGKKNRLKKNEIKQSIAEEFLESDMVKKYSLRKFEELQEQRRKSGLKKTKLNKYKMQNRKKSRKAEYISK